MTSFFRSRPVIAGLALALLFAMTAVPTAHAGEDDFEYGQKLAAKGRSSGDRGWFDYARMVYEKIVNDSTRSKKEMEEARYGLAQLDSGEALALASRGDTSYSEVKKAFTDAIDAMETFVTNNPQHSRVLEAKLAVGQTRLAFVQWARSLLDDAKELETRGAESRQVQQDAKDQIGKAIKYFDELDNGWDEDEGDDFPQVAHYWYVVSKYYACRVHRPCSSAHKNALAEAAIDLDDFIAYFDGTIVAIYAMDFLGLTKQDQADCAGNEEEKKGFFREAMQWFEACIATEWQDRESLVIIARGYLHCGECGLQAGRVGDIDFRQMALRNLRGMTERIPKIGTVDDGLRAMLVWARLELEMEDAAKCLQIAGEVSRQAEASGRGYIARKANELTATALRSGSTLGPVDPGVLKRAADSSFAKGDYRAAVKAYQGVINACSDTVDDLMKFEIPSWQRIALCYRELGDPLSQALALEPIHQAWVDGRIPGDREDANDPNLDLAYKARKATSRAYLEVFQLTGSAYFDGVQKEVERSMSPKGPYGAHEDTGAVNWRLALTKFNEARQMRREKKGGWKNVMKEAEKRFLDITQDTKSTKKYDAWIYIMRAQEVRDDFKALEKTAKDALAFFDSPAAQKEAKEFETVKTRVSVARGQAKVWLSEAYIEQKKYGQVVPLLDGWAVKHGDVKSEFYRSTAAGNNVRALIAKGDIEQAEIALRRLLVEFPDYFRLPKITFGLAQFYKDKYGVISKEYNALSTRLNGNDEVVGLLPKVRELERSANRIRSRLVDLNGVRTNAERLLKTWEEAVAEARAEGGGKKPEDFTNLTQFEADEAKERLEGDPDNEDADKKEGVLSIIARLNDDVRKLAAEIEKNQQEIDDINAKRDVMRPTMYAPLIKAADLYYEWDQVVISTKTDREPSNIKSFADLYRFATLLKPEEEHAWNRARELYESYLGMDGISEEGKNDASAKLGRIYAVQSERVEAGPERDKLVNQAVDLLQAGLAKNPANAQLVVGQLTGEFVVLAHNDTLLQRKIFVPVRMVSTVKEFEDAIRALGTDAGPLPRFTKDIDDSNYRQAVERFKTYVLKMPPAQQQRTVDSFAGAGFDVNFFKRHGNTRRDFRMNLARVLSRTGKDKDALKALGLTDSLLSGSLGLEEETEEWWETKEIQIRSYVQAAKAGLRTGGDEARAKSFLDIAAGLYRALNSQNPSYGKDVRPETRGNLKRLLSEVGALRSRAGMTPVKVTIE